MLIVIVDTVRWSGHPSGYHTRLGYHRHQSDITGHTSEIIGHQSDNIGHQSDNIGQPSDNIGHQSDNIGVITQGC